MLALISERKLINNFKDVVYILEGWIRYFSREVFDELQWHSLKNRFIIENVHSESLIFINVQHLLRIKK